MTEAIPLLQAKAVTKEFAARGKVRPGGLTPVDDPAQAAIAEPTPQGTVEEKPPPTSQGQRAAGTLIQRGHIAAVDDVTLTIPQDPTIISLVGESGSGKTTLSRMLLGLERPTNGTITYRGKDIYAMDKESWTVYRREVQAIFQDPYAIYNPFYHTEHVFQMAIKQFKLTSSREEGRKMMEDSLRAVDLRPHDVLGRYPHQLSGGERQRIMLARIHMLRPRVIIADEPVSMIDAAVRTLFMNILLDFRDQYGISCLFITHNLSTAYYLGGKMAVMCFGRLIESGEMDTIIEHPSHPYTRQLLSSVPSGDPEHRWTTKATYANADRPMTHDAHRCVFAPRCPHVMRICNQERPPQYEVNDGQALAACYLYKDQGVTQTVAPEAVGVRR